VGIGGGLVIRLGIVTWKIGKGSNKRVGKWYGGYWVLWPLCLFGCISVVVVGSASVRDCRELGLWIVGTVG
jgi:hypothetical protein